MQERDKERNWRAIYANHLRIEFNELEVLLYFGHSRPEWDEPAMAARIVTNPVFARDFHTVLDRALKQLDSRQNAEPAPEGSSGE